MRGTCQRGLRVGVGVAAGVAVGATLASLFVAIASNGGTRPPGTLAVYLPGVAGIVGGAVGGAAAGLAKGC